jgi:hypothetical protein
MAKPYDKAITPQQISALLRQMGALKSETGPAGRVRGYHDVSAGYEVSRDKWVSGDGHVMIVWQGGNWDKHYAEMKAFLESKGFVVEQDNVGLHVRAKQEAAPTPPTAAAPTARPSKGGMVDVGSKVTIVRGHNSVKGRTGTVVTRGINKLTVQMDHGGGRTIEVPTNSVELV